MNNIILELCEIAKNLDHLKLFKEANYIHNILIKYSQTTDYLNDVLASDIDPNYVEGLKILSIDQLKDMLKHHSMYPSSQAEKMCIESEIKRRHSNNNEEYTVKLNKWIKSLSDPQLIEAAKQYRTKNPLDKTPVLDALSNEIELRGINTGIANHDTSIGHLDYVNNLRVEMNDQEYNQSFLMDNS